MMDRTERQSGSAELADDAFRVSLAHLSLHIATRQTLPLLRAPPPPRRFARTAWPYVLLIAAVGAAGYCYGALGHGDLNGLAVPRIAAAAPAPAPVLAAIAVAPETALLPPVGPPAKPEPRGPIDTAAALPPPPLPAPPVTLPAPPAAAAPRPEIALSWSEILEVQKRLASLGINPGPIDGVVGPRTTASVQGYEERLGHAVTGKVDRSLLTLLRQDPGAATMLQAQAP
jgi:hypothetical protein